MHENCPDANDLGRLESPEGRIPEQALADAASLIAAVHGQAPQHHHGHGIGHIPPHTAGCRRLQ